MLGAQLCSTPRDGAVDGHDGRSNRLEESVHRCMGSALYWAHHHLGVDAGAHQDLFAHGEPGPQRSDRPLVLAVGGVKERYDNVGIEGYSRHSPRSSSRWPAGYVPAGRLPA